MSGDNKIKHESTSKFADACQAQGLVNNISTVSLAARVQNASSATVQDCSRSSREELIDSLEGCVRQLNGILRATYVGEAIQFCTNRGAFCTEHTPRVFWDERLRHIQDEVDLAEKRLARAKQDGQASHDR